MPWKEKGWNKAPDGSKMKVTNEPDTHKVERISKGTYPHEHEIVKVEKSTGKVIEKYEGEFGPGRRTK